MSEQDPPSNAAPDGPERPGPQPDPSLTPWSPPDPDRGEAGLTRASTASAGPPAAHPGPPVPSPGSSVAYPGPPGAPVPALPTGNAPSRPPIGAPPRAGSFGGTPLGGGPLGGGPLGGGSSAGAATIRPVAAAPAGRHTLRTVLLSALVGAIVAAGLTAAALWDRDDAAAGVGAGGSGVDSGSSAASSRPPATLAGPSLDIHALLQKVRPSVVSIHTGVRGGEAAGSGIVLTEDGVVLTNAHVVEGAQSIEVDFSDGRTADARLLGSVPDADVAVLQAEGLTQPVTPAELGSSDALQVGDSVVAIGNALNLGEAPSVTTGIVSALNRSITASQTVSLDNLIQTDAAINPGNSGGPLINSSGQVVGVNTAILADAQNIGFALAIDEIRSIVEDLKAGRPVSQVRPVLGVETLDAASLDETIRSRFGVTARSGAFVQTVKAGSGAATAGLQQGDVIVSVDGRRVRTSTDVGAAVRSKEPVDSVVIVWERGGTQQQGRATLGSS